MTNEPEDLGADYDEFAGLPSAEPTHGSSDDDAPPPPAVDDDSGLHSEGARFALNDTGNGKRFALYCGDSAMVVPRIGWHVWDGRRWRLDADDISVRRHAQTVQDHIIKEIPHLVLEDWQQQELAKEAGFRAREAALRAQQEAGPLSTDQEIEIEDLTQRLGWIRKIKDQRAKMKGDHRTFAKSTGNKAKIDAMLTEATVEVAREVEDLNADPLTVNTESGLLRFSVDGGGDSGFSRTAGIRLDPHAREVPVEGRDAPQLVTKMMPVAFDPNAECPTFHTFLERVQPNVEMRGFLQRWFGLSMTGLKIQKFAFFYGAGANGKSVLVDLIGRMLGDYSHTAKIESFTGRNRRGGGDATPDIFPLISARMVRTSEPDEGERLQEGMIKEVTGGEPIMVRQLNSDFIEAHPFFKLTMSGNHKPDIRGTDDGIWRRVLLVPFDVQIPAAERDEKLGEKLWSERAGILNWLAEGLVSYLESGLQEPQQVLDATQEYRADSDPIGTFLGDACLVSGDPDDFLYAREIIQGFNLWLDMRGEGMWGDRTVSLKFKGLAGRYRDPRSGKSYSPGKRDATGYRGVRFVDTFKRTFDNAPKDAKGRPVASAAGSGSHDDGGWR
ncbi:hypothetical protein KO516_21470 [Citreicella sp. C3M06]|uniref:DNA primase family protein n=1 Tax=Citreicella sp. C3M06 TaxID=2841564 RepID=UPI001C09EA42|nr:DNA primase family protein [Citreicella sp. C3M06]MBU2963346.1 hypothetical protein [Citreicella sp. C3M06]